MSRAALFVATFILVAGAAAADDDDFDYTCFPGIKPSAGVTIPRGDIPVEVGSDPFPIYCRLNPRHDYFLSGHHSDRLGLYAAASGDDGARWLESTVLNETTIMHMYDPAVQKADQISCKIQLEANVSRGVCHQNILVGVKPLKPENFQCISENWENLVCTWEEPENPVKTSYSLSYIETGRFGRLRHCPEFLPDGKPMPRKTCFLSLRTTPPYRQAMEKYQFLMQFKNALEVNGTIIPLPINSFAVVVPAPPQNLTLVPKGPHDLLLFYNIPTELAFFKPGLISSVRYRSEFDYEWTVLDTSHLNLRQHNYSIPLTGLIPYAEYTFEVRLLSGVADQTEERLWSKTSSKTARTLPKIPERAPSVSQSSFEIVGGLQTRTIYVYWQQIQQSQQNGPDFQYVTTEVFEAGKVRPVNPVNTTNAYAMFSDLSLRNYTFYVASENTMGTSPDANKVFVGHHDQLRGLQPRSFTKIAYNEQLFEVSWIEPLNVQPVTSYTIYWCRTDNNRDRPYQCQGYLDWLEVDRDVRTVNVSLPTNDIYQFAVAANTPKYSSGMIWATCTILHNKVVGKLKTVSVDNVKQDALHVRWRLDCSDRVGIVTGYKISYCAIDSPDDTADCVGGLEMSVVTGPDKEKVWLTDLTPWTRYKVGVAVLTRAGESELSDYHVNRTERDRPGSPPTRFEVELLASNEMALYWQPPAVPNGPIEFYEVRYGFVNFMNRLEETRQTVVGTNMRLRHLKFNSHYTMAVRACTRLPDFLEAMCGKDWAEANVKTGIGASGPMPAPLVTFENSTQVRVEWGHLYHKGGPVKHFELQVTHQALDASRIIEVDGNTNVMSLSLAQIGDEEDWTPDCFNASLTNLYNFTIRAVTFNPETTERFDGEWSPVEVTPAYCAHEFRWFLLLFLLLIVPFTSWALYSYFHGVCSVWCNEREVFKEATMEWAASDMAQDVDAAEASAAVAEAKKKEEDWHANMEAKVGINGDTEGTRNVVYKRAGSKDSMEILLTDPKRNASGNSETTSGCESARSSEIGEEHEHDDMDPSKVTARMNAHDVSNDSMMEEDMDDLATPTPTPTKTTLLTGNHHEPQYVAFAGVEQQQQQQQPDSGKTLGSPGYVAFMDPSQPPPHPSHSQPQWQATNNSYSQCGPDGWQPRPPSPCNEAGQGGDVDDAGDGIPMGYSRVAAVGDGDGDGDGHSHDHREQQQQPGYVMAAATHGLPVGQGQGHGQGQGQPPLNDSGYVAFRDLHNLQQPPSKGFISIAQANKMDSLPNSPVGECDPAVPEMGYSKVGLEPELEPAPEPAPVFVPSANPGYVQQAPNWSGVSNRVGPSKRQQPTQHQTSSQSLMSDTPKQRPPSSSSHHGLCNNTSKIAPLTLELTSFTPSPAPATSTSSCTPSPTSTHPYRQMAGGGIVSIDPEAGGGEPDGHGQTITLAPVLDDASSPSASTSSSSSTTALVMSPKKLQVESKSPYSRVITSLHNSKSSMV